MWWYIWGVTLYTMIGINNYIAFAKAIDNSPDIEQKKLTKIFFLLGWPFIFLVPWESDMIFVNNEIEYRFFNYSNNFTFLVSIIS